MVGFNGKAGDEIAVGTGAGLRYDLSFLVIRWIAEWLCLALYYITRKGIITFRSSKTDWAGT